MNPASTSQRLGWVEAAIAGLALAAAAFMALDEDTEAAMFGLAFLGLLVVRALGIPRRALLVLGLTAGALISVIVAGGFGESRITSTLAHVVLSGVLAWGLSEPVWARLSGPGRPVGPSGVLTLIAVVLVLGVCWEAGEHVADAILGTSISLQLSDSLLDLLADGAGALVGSLVAARATARAGPSATQPSRA